MSQNLHKSLSPGQRFWRLLKPDGREIRNVYVYAIFNGLMSLSLPLGIQAILNLIQGGRISTSWVVLVSLVIIGVAVSGLLQIFQLKITENLQQKIFTKAAMEFAYRIPKIKMEVLYRKYAPELMNRFFDIMAVQKGLSKILIDFSTAAFHVLFGLLLLSLYHPVFIIFSVTLILLIYAIFKFTAKSGLQTSLQESKHKYLVVHWLEELARTSTTFKLAGKTNLPMDRADVHVEDYLNARDNHFKVLVRQYSLLVVFKVIVVTGLLVLGGVLVMEQHMNIGQFVAAEIIIILVINSVEKLILSLETIYDVLTGLEKIGQVTDLELESNEGVEIEEGINEKGLEVELSNIDFSFPDQNELTIRDLSIAIKPGEKITVIGANRSGKSTLLHLIAGLYNPNKGYIAYSGLPKGNYNPIALRTVIGDSLTQEQLFEGSILENISMGRESATLENVKWAIQNLGLNEFIKSQPKGYNTKLDPMGRNLPRSIVQKLLLARSIAHKPKLLLLEDAFEHLEEKDRKCIIDFLTKEENNWTLVAVSSDAYMAEICGQLVVMEKGKIINKGSYEALKNNSNLKFNKHA